MYIKNQRVKLTDRKKEETTVIFYVCCFGGNRVKLCGAKGMVQYHWLPLSVFMCQSLDHCNVQIHIFVYPHLLVFSSINIFYVYVTWLSRIFIFFYNFRRISSSQDFNFLKQFNSCQLNLSITDFQR